MCRTVGRQFPPSRKVTLRKRKKNRVPLCCEWMQIGGARIQITEWETGAEEQAQYLVDNHVGVVTRSTWR